MVIFYLLGQFECGHSNKKSMTVKEVETALQLVSISVLSVGTAEQCIGTFIKN